MWNLVGHAWAVDLLRRSSAANQLAHAYLITGLPQVGRTTLALQLARALNCATADARPCGTCSPCRRIGRGIHPDVRVVQAAAGVTEEEGGRRASSFIRIEQIEELQHEAVLAPYEGRAKVYILRNAEDLHQHAANRFLKTLEEPPPHVIFVLTALDPTLLLPTIVSRCQIVPLRPVPANDIARALTERHGTEPELAARLARLSEGRPGWALAAAQQPDVLAEYDQRRAELIALLAAGDADRLSFTERLKARFDRDRAAAGETLRLWSVWWRDVLLTQTGLAHRIANDDHREMLDELARTRSLEQVTSYLAEIRETAAQLGQNVSPQLALDVLFLRLPPASAPSRAGSRR